MLRHDPQDEFGVPPYKRKAPFGKMMTKIMGKKRPTWVDTKCTAVDMT